VGGRADYWIKPFNGFLFYIFKHYQIKLHHVRKFTFDWKFHPWFAKRTETKIERNPGWRPFQFQSFFHAMIVKIMSAIKLYGGCAWYTFNKTNITIIITRLLVIILSSTLFMEAWRTIYLAFDTITGMVAFKNFLACILSLQCALLILTNILQGEWLLRIHMIDLRIAIPAMFGLLKLLPLFACIAKMIRCGLATSALFRFACTILAYKTIVNVMLL